MSSLDVNLKRLRQLRGMKQDELAERMNITRQTVSGWETGRRQPDLDSLIKLSEVLDVDIHELIYGNKPESYPKYQRKYVMRATVCVGILAFMIAFRLLIWPYLIVVSSQKIDVLPLIVCYYFYPPVAAFVLGVLIPTFISLYVPIELDARLRNIALVLALILIIPIVWILVRAIVVNRWSIWIQYPIGKAMISYIMPFISGVLFALEKGAA